MQRVNLFCFLLLIFVVKVISIETTNSNPNITTVTTYTMATDTPCFPLTVMDETVAAMLPFMEKYMCLNKPPDDSSCILNMAAIDDIMKTINPSTSGGGDTITAYLRLIGYLRNWPSYRSKIVGNCLPPELLYEFKGLFGL